MIVIRRRVLRELAIVSMEWGYRAYEKGLTLQEAKEKFKTVIPTTDEKGCFDNKEVRKLSLFA